MFYICCQKKQCDLNVFHVLPRKQKNSTIFQCSTGIAKKTEMFLHPDVLQIFFSFAVH